MIKKTLLLLAGVAAITSLSSIAQPIGQWDFNLGTLNPTVGTLPLTYSDAGSSAGVTFGTTSTLGIPDIAGAPAAVAKIDGFTTPGGLRMPVASDGNGGGSLVNQYTYLVDVLFPTTSNAKWRALLDIDHGVISKDAEFFVDEDNGIGITTYSGNVTANAWHRIAFAVDIPNGQIRKYIDGVLVGIQASGNLEGRWALSHQTSDQPFAELFTDDNGEVAPAYVNSIQLWNRALSSGEIEALGTPAAAGIPQAIGAVPAFIESSTPQMDAVNISFLPALNVILNSGNSTISQDSLKMLFDGAEVPAITGPAGDGIFSLDYEVTTPLDPASKHTVGVVYTEGATVKTKSFSFTVQNYQKINLPEPFILENFDLVEEGNIPAGWVRTNHTDVHLNTDELGNLRSNRYLDWTVVTDSRLGGLKARIFNKNTILLNGEEVTRLGNGPMLYAESDVRSGNQVQVIFTKDFDFTGKKNVFVAFKSTYEQNQDNINALEYSIDEGATWLPAIYMLDNNPNDVDIFFNADGTVNALTTLNTARSGQAWGAAYGAYIGAVVSQDLAPYISGRIDDNDRDSKRIERFRLWGADNKPKVRLRFVQAGTGSWYWGVDDLGFYEIPEPIITVQPIGTTVNYGTSATFKVVVSGEPTLTYQWYKNDEIIPNATAATYTVTTSAVGTDAASYTVKAQNTFGSVTSNPAVLVVNVAPIIATPPAPVLASVGAGFSLSVTVNGQSPFTYQWKKGGVAIDGATSSVYVVPTSTLDHSGDYTVTINNVAGSITSPVAKVIILPLIPITQDLVVHLPFDADANDTSGRGNNGTPEVQDESVLPGGTLPAVSTATKLIGAGSINLKKGQHVAMGAPDDLNFGSDVNFTYSFWVRGADANAWTGDPSFIGNKNWDSSNNLGHILAAGGSGSMRWSYRAAVGAVASPRRDISGIGQVADGQWHNVLISHDRTGLAYIYVDGVLRNTMTIANDGDIAGNAGSIGTYIGQDGTGTYGFVLSQGNWFNDINFDDIGIWRRLLTPQEAASIYSNGKAGNDLTHASGEVIVLPPTITTAPISKVVSAGATVALTVGVGGTAPFTYVWKKGTTVIPGENGATLTLTDVDADDTGDYTVTASNGGGDASASASIQVVTGAISDSLVAHIKFDGNYSDSSGRGNNATPRGAPTLVEGKFGQAMQFTTDGATINYASFGKPADLNFAEGDFSASMWVNWTTSADDLPFVSNKDWNSSNNIGWGAFSQDNGNVRLVATGTPRGSGNKTDFTTGPSVMNGNWHHVVTTFWRGKAAATYIDGVLANTAPLVITGSVDAGLETNIGQDGTGAYTDNNGVHMTGKIDDVALWRRVLSAQEVSRIFAASGDLSTLSGTPFKITGFTLSSGQLQITISGAAGNARLEKRAGFGAGTSWQDVGPASASLSIDASTGVGFYRVVNP